MKRARIKAMVTVPARRKVTQNVLPSKVLTTSDDTMEIKNKSDVNSTPIQSTSDPASSEIQLEKKTQILEEMNAMEPDALIDSNEYNDKCVQNLEELTGNTMQQQESQEGAVKMTQSRVGFMRPMPRFDNACRVRKNSMQGSAASASDSEDDNKKISNITACDSTQIVQNTKDATNSSAKTKTKTSKVGQKRRVALSDSARKLAEARREFQLKHENKTPDRSKLTMYDLIYYNPITNPMKKSIDTQVPITKKLEPEFEQTQEEMIEDDPLSAMPVPQVKVGPDGQLVIDEQSLIIEQTDIKKNKEALTKEVIVDNDNNGHGFYKRRQKSKDWSIRDTIKFYKALNTVGTDFSLMKSLFPDRSRREIKIKFKKEERMNKDLVEKTLAYHHEFDIEVLENTIATLEKLEQEQAAIVKRKWDMTENGKIIKSKKKRRTRIVASSISEMEAPTDEDNCKMEIKTKMEHEEYNDLSNENLNPKSEDEDSPSDVYHVRPTRSGRIPKVRKLQGPNPNTLQHDSLQYDSDNTETNNTESLEDLISEDIDVNPENLDTNRIKTVMPNIDNVEPGSLVILSKESIEEPGKSVLQVYMVSPDVNLQNDNEANVTGNNISSELLATVTATLPEVERDPLNEEQG